MAFLLALMAAIPMLLHVAPRSECLLFVTITNVSSVGWLVGGLVS